MSIKLSIKKRPIFRLNPIIISIILIIGTVILFFLYSLWRNTVELYVYASLNRNRTVYYWVADAIKIGDTDVSILGTDRAEVIDKETFEAGGNSKTVFLLLKVKVTKDRRGVYLYKNQPLLAGDSIELKLSSMRDTAGVIYVGKEPPKYKHAKVSVNLRQKGILPEDAEAIKVNDQMTNNKGEILAKIIDKKVNFAEVRVDTESGLVLVSFDRTKRDVFLAVELRVKEVDNAYIFQEFQKVKANETITLPFKYITLYKYDITSVSEAKE